MKHCFIIYIFCVLGFYTKAQNFSVSYAEEMKFKRGTTGLEIIAADKSGIYLSQIRAFSSNTKLIKTDQSFNTVYEKDYEKYMDERVFETFTYLDDKLFLFTREYKKKQKSVTISCIQIDKNSGSLIDTWKNIAVYTKETEKDEINIDIKPLAQKTGYIIITTVESTDKIKIYTQIVDVNAAPKINSTIVINFTPKLYELEEVKITKNNNLIVLGKEYDEVETLKKKKKTKTIVFKQYLLGLYNISGEKIADIPIDATEKFVLGAKLIEQSTGEMLLAGFYSNTTKKQELAGFFMSKIDSDKGILLSSTSKEINAGMLGKFKEEADTDNDSKKPPSKKPTAKEEDSTETEEALAKNYIIRTVDINPTDSSIIITAEVMHSKSYSVTQTEWTGTGNFRTMRVSTYYRHLFYNNDVLIINTDKEGNVRWLNLLHKSQVENYITYATGIDINYDLRKNYTGMFSSSLFPYYSSFKIMFYKNNLLIIYNDNVKNKNNLGIQDDIYTIANFSKHSNVYAVTIDLTTGKMKKKSIAPNDEETVLMPRHSYVIGNTIFAPSWKIKLVGKTTFKLAKITVK